MKKILSISLIVIGLGAVIWGGYSYFFKTTTAQTTYQTSVVEKGNLVISISSSGQVSAANSGSITTNASGVIKTLFVKNDQIVKSGDKIAEIDLDLESKQKYLAASSSYQSAKNSLESAKANLFSLQNTLFATNQKFMNGAVVNGLAKEDPNYIQENASWLAAEANYKNQLNVINQAQMNVNSSWLAYQQASPIIYAPISGKVTGLSLQVGSVITSSGSSQKIASIKTEAAPTLTINLTEIDAPKVKVGNKVTLTFDALVGKTYTGSVISVDTVGIVSSGVTNYPTTIKLDTANEEIFPNMSVQANIITDIKNDVLLIPFSAIETQNGQTTIKIMKDNQPTSVNVEVGLSSTTQSEIVSGVSEGDTVITGTTSTSTTTNTSTRSVFSSVRIPGGMGR